MGAGDQDEARLSAAVDLLLRALDGNRPLARMPGRHLRPGNAPSMDWVRSPPRQTVRGIRGAGDRYVSDPTFFRTNRVGEIFSSSSGDRCPGYPKTHFNLEPGVQPEANTVKICYRARHHFPSTLPGWASFFTAASISAFRRLSSPSSSSSLSSCKFALVFAG